MPSKKFLIVGAGPGQVPAIEKAREIGCRALAIDQNPNAVGMNIADESSPVDISDVDSVLSFAQSHNVDGILTLQSDVGVPAVGRVVDEMNLPGIGEAVAKICTNKRRMQKEFDRKGVPSPQNLAASSTSEARMGANKIGYPCLTKPVDSSGSRGINKISSEDEVESAFSDSLSYSKRDMVVVEELVEGLEVGAQAFSRGGACELVAVHNDTVKGDPHYVPVGHSYPSQLNVDMKEKVLEVVKKGVESLGIHSGPSNIDLIIDKSGQPKILEISPRIGATCLPELTTYFTGIDWIEVAIKSALGDDVDLNSRYQNPCAGRVIEAPEDGTLDEFKISDRLRKREDVLHITREAKVGDKVSKLRNGTDRIGTIVVKGTSWEKAENKVKEIESNIKICVV